VQQLRPGCTRAHTVVTHLADHPCERRWTIDAMVAHRLQELAGDFGTRGDPSRARLSNLYFVLAVRALRFVRCLPLHSSRLHFGSGDNFGDGFQPAPKDGRKRASDIPGAVHCGGSWIEGGLKLSRTRHKRHSAPPPRLPSRWRRWWPVLNARVGSSSLLTFGPAPISDACSSRPAGRAPRSLTGRWCHEAHNARRVSRVTVAAFTSHP
jgi:hypothetical protein